MEEEIKKAIINISKIKRVDAVYLFGSFLTGKMNKFSDVDICVIGKLSENEKYRVRSEFLSDKYDVCFFNSLPIWIQMRIFKEGKMLFSRDNEKIRRMKMITLRGYLDFKYSINKFSKEIFGCMI